MFFIPMQESLLPLSPISLRNYTCRKSHAASLVRNIVHNIALTEYGSVAKFEQSAKNEMKDLRDEFLPVESHFHTFAKN